MITQTPTKPSNLEQLRVQARQQNLEDSGDLEPSSEFKDTIAEADKPKYRQHKSFEDLQDFLSQNSREMARGIYVLSENSSANLRERVFDNTADAVEAFLRNERADGKNMAEIGGRTKIEFNADQAVAEAESIATARIEVPSIFTNAYEENQPEMGNVRANSGRDNIFKRFVPEINFGLLFGVLVKGGKELFGAAIKGFKENVTFKDQQNQADMTPEQIKAKEEEEKRKKVISQNADRIAQAQGVPGVEMQRAQQEEDKQVNLVTKIQAGFRGLRLFDKLRPYYEALFKRGQLEEAERQKKAEKQASFAQATQQSKITADLDAGIEGGTGRGIVSVTGPNASAG